MLPTFDGHNDALTREDHADLVRGRKGGRLLAQLAPRPQRLVAVSDRLTTSRLA